MKSKTLFDVKAPSALTYTQKWFASIIGRPIDLQNHMDPISPTGALMKEEAQQFIAPSARLAADQRIEIYNQQYWWRLLSSLQQTFPLLTRLFGYAAFNETIAVPYLVKYPPDHWSVALVGSRLIRWIEEEYHQDDKQFILDAAKIDWAFDSVFVAFPYPPIETAAITEDGAALLSEKTLYLQNYVELFMLPYDLLSFRTAFVKEDGDYWIEHEFPPLAKEKDHFFAIYRTQKNYVNWKEISLEEYQLLKSFKKGATIEEACDALEKQGEVIYNRALENVAAWFQEWMARRWLCLGAVQNL